MSEFLVWQGKNGGEPVSKVGFLVDGTEYGQTAKAAYADAAKAAGLDVVGTRTLEQGQTNLSAQMTQLKQSGAEAIYASTYLESSMGAIRTMDSIGWAVPYMTVGSGIVHPAFFDLGGLAEGVTSSTAWSASLKNEKSQEFAKEYEAKYDAVPTDDAAYAYAAGYLMQEAAENAGDDVSPASIAKSLRTDEFKKPETNIIPTDGVLKFDEKGQAHPSILMAQAQGGEWKVVFPDKFAAAKFKPIG